MGIEIIILGFVLAATGCSLTKNHRLMGVLSIGAASILLVQALRIAYEVSIHGIYSPLSFISVDPLGAIVVLIIAVVGFCISVYSIPYIENEFTKGIVGNFRVKEYFVLFNLFILAMFLAIAGSYPILSWIFLEATTLSTAFLISLYNKPSTIEAAWKFLIINSLGLLLGLFGTLLYFSSLPKAINGGFVSWHTLAMHAAQFDPAIAKIAFIFILIGYGTKAGLAPMHTWLPDAHSKAPAPISALMSAVLLNVAFVLVLRFKGITDVGVGQSFTQHLLIVTGILSVAIAAFIIFTSRNYKRLLAYSSIENIGIMALGFGFGGIGAFAAIMSMIYHALIKSALFLSAGSLLIKYSSAKIHAIRGALTTLPLTSLAIVLGALAITGTPPFGMFVTKIYILTAGVKHYPLVSVLLLMTTVIVFVSFFRHLSNMMFGDKPKNLSAGETNRWLAIPSLSLILVAIILSFYIPHFLQVLINQSAAGF